MHVYYENSEHEGQTKEEIESTTTQHGVVFRAHGGALQGEGVTGPVQHMVPR